MLKKRTDNDDDYTLFCLQYKTQTRLLCRNREVSNEQGSGDFHSKRRKLSPNVTRRKAKQLTK